MEEKQSIQAEAERFRRVWQRVQAGETESPVLPNAPISMATAAAGDPNIADILRQAVTQSLDRAAACRRWPELWKMAEGCVSQARRLSAALFLETGVRFLPVETGMLGDPSGLLESCRSLFFRMRRAEAFYRATERRMPDGNLWGLFHELAGECAIWQQQLRMLIERRI
ncbi:MAG: hypothetical protein LIO45_07925 [Clostridiales bacterium]|nr:hypothetical protein [Clostridiales bacterium]